MKKILLIFAILAVSMPSVWAQKQNLNFNIKQVEPGGKNNLSEPVTGEDLYSRYSTVTPISGLMQLAAEANNVAKIRIEGNENAAVIMQNGSNITGAININGFNNEAKLNQSGTNLLSLIAVEGSNNDLSMTQAGNDIGNLIQLEGSNININLTHNEAGFKYMQGGKGAQPIRIQSTSNYLPIIIRNN